MYFLSENAKNKGNGVIPYEQKGANTVLILDRIALALVIIGALNWGSIGLFAFDAVAWIGGGQLAVFSRIVYTIVALAGIWCISMLFRPAEETVMGHE